MGQGGKVALIILEVDILERIGTWANGLNRESGYGDQGSMYLNIRLRVFRLFHFFHLCNSKEIESSNPRLSYVFVYFHADSPTGGLSRSVSCALFCAC